MQQDRSMLITIDTQEQRGGYRFDDIESAVTYRTKVESMKTADYATSLVEIGSWRRISALDAAASACVERKSLSDLFGSTTQSVRRRRLKSEFERMKQYGYAAVVIESTMLGVATSPPPMTKANPKAVLATMLAWGMRTGVHVWFADCARIGELWTFRILERWHRDGAGRDPERP